MRTLVALVGLLGSSAAHASNLPSTARQDAQPLGLPLRPDTALTKRPDGTVTRGRTAARHGAETAVAGAPLDRSRVRTEIAELQRRYGEPIRETPFPGLYELNRPERYLPRITAPILMTAAAEYTSIMAS